MGRVLRITHICQSIICRFKNSRLTLASNACLKISQSVFALSCDFPVSVANKMVALTLLAMACPMSLAENFTALQVAHKHVRCKKNCCTKLINFTVIELN